MTRTYIDKFIHATRIRRKCSLNCLKHIFHCYEIAYVLCAAHFYHSRRSFFELIRKRCENIRPIRDESFYRPTSNKSHHIENAEVDCFYSVCPCERFDESALCELALP